MLKSTGGFKLEKREREDEGTNEPDKDSERRERKMRKSEKIHKGEPRRE